MKSSLKWPNTVDNFETRVTIHLTCHNAHSSALIAGKHLPPYRIVVDFSGFCGFLAKRGLMSAVYGWRVCHHRQITRLLLSWAIRRLRRDITVCSSLSLTLSSVSSSISVVCHIETAAEKCNIIRVITVIASKLFSVVATFFLSPIWRHTLPLHASAEAWWYSHTEPAQSSSVVHTCFHRPSTSFQP